MDILLLKQMNPTPNLLIFFNEVYELMSPFSQKEFINYQRFFFLGAASLPKPSNPVNDPMKHIV